MAKTAELYHIAKLGKPDGGIAPPEGELVTHLATQKHWRLAFILLLADVFLVVASSQVRLSHFLNCTIL